MTNYIKKLLALAVAACGLTSAAWATDVISINFGSDRTDASMADQAAGVMDGSYAGSDIPANSWNDYSEASATEAAVTKRWNGSSIETLSGVTVTYKGRGGNWSPNNRNETARFMNGYIDDNSASVVQIVVKNIPYDKYDIILYYQGDNGGHKFRPVDVNGTYYSFDDTTQKTVKTANNTSPLWGTPDMGTLDWGKNALHIQNLSGANLEINPGPFSSSLGGFQCRGTVAAVQIMPTKVGTSLEWANNDLSATLSQAAWGEFKLKIPASESLKRGSIVALKRIKLAARNDKNRSTTYLIFKDGETLHASTAKTAEADWSVDASGTKREAHIYDFEGDGVNLTVGETYSVFASDAADSYPTPDAYKGGATCSVQDFDTAYLWWNNSVSTTSHYLPISEVTVSIVELADKEPALTDPVTFTLPVSTDWDDRTLPTEAHSTTARANVSFANDPDYRQTLGSRQATVAQVTDAAANTLVYGLHAFNGGAGIGAIDRDIYLKVEGGTPGVISGGEDANWSGTKTIPTGNVLVNISGDTQVDYVYGAGLGGGTGGTLAKIDGNIGIVVEDNAQVKGSLIGGWQSRHNAIPEVTGNISILVKSLQTHFTDATITDNKHCEQGYIAGGGVFNTNGGRSLVRGNTSVAIDLSGLGESATGNFMKHIVGGGLGMGGGDGNNVNGSSSVTITAPKGIVFPKNITGGGHSTGTNGAKVGGNSSVTLTGGTYTGTIMLGGDNGNSTLVSGSASLTIDGADISAATIQLGAASGTKYFTAKSGSVALDKLAGFNDITFGETVDFVFADGTPPNTAVVLADATKLTYGTQSTGKLSLSAREIHVGSLAITAVVEIDFDAKSIKYIIESSSTLRRRSDAALGIDPDDETDPKRAWTTPNSWLTADGVPCSWPTEGADFVIIDANEVSSIIVDTKVKIGTMLNLSNSAEAEGEAGSVFKFLTKEDLDHVATPDPDPAYVIDGKVSAADFGGDLYLQSRILQSVALGEETRVFFVAMEAGKETTAYPYEFTNRRHPICKIGPGAFIVPSSMYTYDFNVRNGQLVFDIPSGETAEISGTMQKDAKLEEGAVCKLVKRGLGVMEYTPLTRVAFMDGVEIEKGTFRLKRGGANYDFWNAASNIPTVLVKNGGVLDLNARGGFKADITLEGGATLADDSASGIGDGSASICSITLTGDAIVRTDSQFGLLANGYGETTFNPAGFTLTKKGTGVFYLTHATMPSDATGSIVVTAGSLRATRSASTLSGLTVEMGPGTTYVADANMTVRDFVVSPNVTRTGTGLITANQSVAYVGAADSVFTWVDVALGAGAETIAPETDFTMKVPFVPTHAGKLPAHAKVEVTITDVRTATNFPIGGVSADKVTVYYEGAVYTGLTVETSDTAISVAPATARKNPVTGDAVAFYNFFKGTVDNDWSTIGNWYTLNESGELVEWTHSVAPMKPGTSDAGWGPALVAGSLIENPANRTVHLDTMEGWNLRLGLFDGVNVTVDTLNKFQRDGGVSIYLMVDKTSSIDFKTVVLSKTDPIAFYVANEDGIVFESAFDKENAITYHFADDGSVNYAGGVSAGTHTIGTFDFAIGDSTKKMGIASKKLISLGATSSAAFALAATPTVKITDAAAHGGVTPVLSPTGSITADSPFGTYILTKKDDGVYVQYKGYGDDVEQLTPVINRTTNLSTFSFTGVTDVIVQGAATCEDAFSVYFDREIPDGVNFKVSGHVNFRTGSGVTTLPANKITLLSDACLGIAAPFDADYTIPSGRKVRVIADMTFTHAVTLTGATLEIAKDATLTFGANNRLSNNGTFHIYGSLALGAYNLEFNSHWATCKYYFYAGSSITGTTGKFGQVGGYDPEIHIVDFADGESDYVTFDVIYEKLGAYSNKTIFVFEGANTGLKFLKANNNAEMHLRAAAGKINGLELVGANATVTAVANCLAGTIKLANGRTLTLQGDNAFATGAILDLAGTAAVNGGATTQNFDGFINVASGSANYPAAFSDASQIDKIGAGTLVMGLKRPVMDLRQGKVRITATPAEIEAGKLELSVKPGATVRTDDPAEVVSASGDNIPVKKYELDAERNIIILTLGTTSIDHSMTVTEIVAILPEGGAVAVIGADDCLAKDDPGAVVITFDRELPDEISLSVTKHVNFVTSGSVTTIPADKFSIAEGGCLRIYAPLSESAYTIAAKSTLITAYESTAAMTFTNNGTLKSEKSLAYTLTSAATATNIVVAGEATVTASGDQAIKGVVEIARGATFVNGRGDAISYGTPGTTVNVHGTLAMGETRWTVGGASQINLYGGAEVSGVGTGDLGGGIGILDIHREGNTINLFKNVGEFETDTTAVIAGTIRVRNANGGIWVAEGMTLELTGGLTSSDVANAKVTRRGEGHFGGIIPLKGNNITLDYGANVGTIPARFVVIEDANAKLRWTNYETDAPVSTTDTKENPFILVETGATLAIDGHNYSGHTGDLLNTGWIVNRGTVTFLDDGGQRYFRQPLLLGDGSTLRINSGDSKLRLYGGAGAEDLAQIMLPSGSATIETGVVGSGNGGIQVEASGAGVSIGAGAKLTITAPLVTGAGAPLTKWGAGTLAVGLNRPVLDIKAGLVHVQGSSTEIVSGEITFPKPTVPGAYADSLRAVNAAGETLEIRDIREDGDNIILVLDARNAYPLTDFVDITAASTATLTDFPVLLTISEDRIKGFKYERAGLNGSELSFHQLKTAEEYDIPDTKRDSSGDVVLPYEIVEWNPSGESRVWVKINSDAIAEGAKGKFRMYWHSAPGAKKPTLPNAADVWTAYAGVWHMDEEINSAMAATAVSHDSTANRYDAEPQSGSAATADLTQMISVPGVIGNARVNSSVTSVQRGNRLQVSRVIPDIGQSLMFSGWYKLNGSAGSQRFFGNKVGNDGNGWSVELQAGTTKRIRVRVSGSGSQMYTIANEFPDLTENWVFMSFNIDVASKKVYSNGTLLWSANDAARVNDVAAPYSFGANSDGSEFSLNGAYDELRLHKGAVSDEWIKAEYDTVRNPDTFFSFGLVNRPVTDEDPTERTWIDYWRVEPSLKYYWEIPSTPSAADITGGAGELASGNFVMYTIYAMPDLTPLTDLPTAKGLYSVNYRGSRTHDPSGVFYTYLDGDRNLEFEIIEDKGSSDFPGGATGSGRVLLVNDDAEAGVTGQAIENWTIDGATSTLTNEGRLLWRLKHATIGNVFEEGVLPENYNTLPYKSSLGDAGNAQIVLGNTTDAVIESGFFTNGIGTVYFDAVNVTRNLSDITGRATLVLQTTTFDFDDPDAEWSEPIELKPILIEGTTLSNLTATTSLECLKVTAGGDSSFVRVVAPVNLKAPSRFRIRRVTEVPEVAEDAPLAAVLVDNLIVSYANQAPELEMKGQYFEGRSPKTVLGVETAFDVDYPAVGDTVFGRASLVGGDVSTVESLRMRYRWRYLREGEDAPWSVVYFNKDGSRELKTENALLLPARTGDVEYYFDMTAISPYYVYVDYTGRALGVGDYTEKISLDHPIESRANKLGQPYPSRGRDWFVRLRDYPSATRGYTLYATTATNVAPTKLSLELTGPHQWRGYLSTSERSGFQGKTILYRFESETVVNPGERELEFAKKLEIASAAARTLPASVELKTAASTNEWSSVPCDAATGYLMFMLDEETHALTVAHADYQDFNRWHDAHVGDYFVGSSELDEKKSGVSAKMREYFENFATWTDTPATKNQWREPFEVTGSFPTQFPTCVPFSTAKSPNGWIAGNGMWVSRRFMIDNSQGAFQMQGQGLGYLEYPGSSLGNPRGLESISYKARLAESIDFNNIGYKSPFVMTSATDYTLEAHVAMSDTYSDEKPNITFDGAGTMSLVAYYQPYRGCYEFRFTRIQDGQVEIALYKWAPNAKGQVVATLLNRENLSRDLNFSRKWWSDGRAQYPSIYLSAQKVVDESGHISVQIMAGLSGNHKPVGEMPTGFRTLTYWDDDPGYLKTGGSYGLVSANCHAHFVGVRSLDEALRWLGGSAKGANKTNTQPDFPGPSFWNSEESDLADGRWYMPAVRQEYFSDFERRDGFARYGVKAAAIPQDLFLQYKLADSADWITFATNSVTSFSLSDQVTVELKNIKDATYRLAHGASREEVSTDIVVDDVELRQWRGDEYGSADTSAFAAPNDGYGYRTNIVFTSGWIHDHKVKLSSARTLENKPSSIRSPLMDGLSDRGLGLGMVSFTYENAEADTRLLVQIATNNVTGSITTETSSIDPAIWTTVAELDFSTMGESERRSGKFSHYLGLHGVKGIMRIATAQESTGSVDITSVIFRDEPSLDFSSWWGWNVRTLNDDASSDYDDGYRMYLADDYVDSSEGPGLSIALNNSIVRDINPADAAAYAEHMPFVQTPTFVSNVVGEVSFKARKFGLSAAEQNAEVRLYGAVNGSPSAEASGLEWTELHHFTITNTYYETYRYRSPGMSYRAFRFAVTGVEGVTDKGPNPTEGPTPVRVMIDEIAVTEAVYPLVGFRYVYPVRTEMTTHLKSPAVFETEFGVTPNCDEQPLLNENWTLQAQIEAKQLPEELDLDTPGHEPRVYVSWYKGNIPWGFENWKKMATAKSAELVAVEGDKMTFRGSFDRAPAAVIGESDNEGAVFQYMASVVYYDKEGEVHTNVLSRTDWVKPYWYDPIDYNAARPAFSAFAILESISPRRVWINEVNVYDGDIDNKDNQFIEIAVPANQALDGWWLEYIDNTRAATNLLCTFGKDVPGEKIGPETNDYTFIVLQSPRTRDRGTWNDTYAPDGHKIVIDGTWKNFGGSGDLDNSLPIALRLVRPSQIVEHEFALEGTNIWAGTRYEDRFTMAKYVEQLIDADESGLSHFFAAGSEIDNKAAEKKLDGRSLSVITVPGHDTADWSSRAHQTPGWCNEGEIVPEGYAIYANGAMIVITANVEGGNIRQTFGDEVMSTNIVKVAVMKGGAGTNITYTVDNWYELKSLTTNKVEIAELEGKTKTFSVTVGAGCSNNIAVVATSRLMGKIADYIGERNRFEAAILDWLVKGKTMRGEFANPGEIHLGEYKNLKDEKISDLSLTEMYWLDMDPTEEDWVLKAGIVSVTPIDKPTEPTTRMKTAGIAPSEGEPDVPSTTSSDKNLRIKVKMTITNENNHVSYAPYVLRSVRPGVTSIDFEAGGYDGNWDSANFKITGNLINGQPKKDPWTPLRWFYFLPDFDKPNLSASFDEKNEATIDVYDPFENKGGTTSGWDKWPGCPVFYSWAIDERSMPTTVEPLTPTSTY